jgi:tol-pal system protein YbgF
MFTQLVLGTLLAFLAGSGTTSSAAVEQEAVLEEIQRQIIQVRNEFKHRIQQAEQDRQAIQENLNMKLEEVVNGHQSVQTSFTEFKQDLEALHTVLDAYDSQIADFEQQFDTLEAEMNTQIDTIETRLADIKQHGIRRKPATGAASRPEPGESESGPIFDFAPGQLFRAAYRTYMEGDYEVAIAGFQKYLEQYPETQLAGAAQYWTAEALSRLEAYEIAIQEYDRLIQTYPQNDKIPDAYYGKGLALLQSGYPAEAREQFTYVINHFPNTPAAQKAARRLEEIR